MNALNEGDLVGGSSRTPQPIQPPDTENRMSGGVGGAAGQGNLAGGLDPIAAWSPAGDAGVRLFPRSNLAAIQPI